MKKNSTKAKNQNQDNNQVTFQEAKEIENRYWVALGTVPRVEDPAESGDDPQERAREMMDFLRTWINVSAEKFCFSKINVDLTGAELYKELLGAVEHLEQRAKMKRFTTWEKLNKTIARLEDVKQEMLTFSENVSFLKTFLGGNREEFARNYFECPGEPNEELARTIALLSRRVQDLEKIRVTVAE